mgnify:FL=1
MINLKYCKEYFKKNQYFVLFLAVLLIFGIFVGLYLGVSHIDILKEEVTYFVNNISNRAYNYLFFHFFVFVIGIVTSFLAIGVPFLCTVIFYEGMSIGFLIGIFSVTYGLTGFVFSIIFILITKLFYLICLLFLFSKCLRIARKMIGKYIYKTDPSIIVVHLVKGCALCTFLLVIYDTLLWGFGNKILPLFNFLIL